MGEHGASSTNVGHPPQIDEGGGYEAQICSSGFVWVLRDPRYSHKVLRATWFLRTTIKSVSEKELDVPALVELG